LLLNLACIANEDEMNWFRRIFVLRSKVRFLPPEPRTPFYAIGDLHGCVDLLETLLKRLEPSVPVVFVGDYVDRGENSKEVLALLQGLNGDPDLRVQCLMGNHEDMLLSFLDNPEQYGRGWLRNGGLQTLASFGVAGVSELSSTEALISAGHQLRGAMGEAQISWLRHLPLFWRSGTVAVVHAGTDPEHSIEDQDRQSLLWGHPDFHQTPRRDRLWVVHGHRIVDEPLVRNGIISIDTGAFATGRLTAALIGNGSVEFIST
jgi:serine/threonine protein phosphatase 1